MTDIFELPLEERNFLLQQEYSNLKYAADSGAFKPNIREKVIRELLQTEKDYLNDLLLLKIHFKEQLTMRGLITLEQSGILFSTSEELAKLNKVQVAGELQKRFDAIEAAGVPLFVLPLGQFFLNMSESLKEYTEYCANQPKALAMLDALKKKEPDFAAFIQTSMDSNPAVRGLSLLSFIIKPVQRLCKYPLLIRELLGNTDPNSVEHATLNMAAEAVNSTVKYVNAQQDEAEKKLQENREFIANLESSIKGAEILELSADVNREIRKIGDLQRVDPKKKKLAFRRIFCFNNLVVMAELKKKVKDSNVQFKLDGALKISAAQIVDLADSNDNLIRHAFELSNKQNGVAVIFNCSSMDEKKTWVKTVRTLVKEYQIMDNARRKMALKKRELHASTDSTASTSTTGTSVTPNQDTAPSLRGGIVSSPALMSGGAGGLQVDPPRPHSISDNGPMSQQQQQQQQSPSAVPTRLRGAPPPGPRRYGSLGNIAELRAETRFNADGGDYARSEGGPLFSLRGAATRTGSLGENSSPRSMMSRGDPSNRGDIKTRAPPRGRGRPRGRGTRGMPVRGMPRTRPRGHMPVRGASSGNIRYRTPVRDLQRTQSADFSGHLEHRAKEFGSPVLSSSVGVRSLISPRPQSQFIQSSPKYPRSNTASPAHSDSSSAYTEDRYDEDGFVIPPPPPPDDDDSLDEYGNPIPPPPPPEDGNYDQDGYLIPPPPPEGEVDSFHSPSPIRKFHSPPTALGSSLPRPGLRMGSPGSPAGSPVIPKHGSAPRPVGRPHPTRGIMRGSPRGRASPRGSPRGRGMPQGSPGNRPPPRGPRGGRGGFRTPGGALRRVQSVEPNQRPQSMPLPAQMYRGVGQNYTGT